MKDWFVQNIVALLGLGCTIHTGAAAFFATWIRSKPSRVEIDNRFESLQLIIIEIKEEGKRSNDLHYQTAVQLGEIKAVLDALKESSQREDNNLKELIKKLEK